MILSGNSTLYKHPKAQTLYLTIPARMAQDSQFDMKAGDKVLLTYMPKGGSNKTPVLVIHRLRRKTKE